MTHEGPLLEFFFLSFFFKIFGENLNCLYNQLAVWVNTTSRQKGEKKSVYSLNEMGRESLNKWIQVNFPFLVTLAGDGGDDLHHFSLYLGLCINLLRVTGPCSWWEMSCPETHLPLPWDCQNSSLFFFFLQDVCLCNCVSHLSLTEISYHSKKPLIKKENSLISWQYPPGNIASNIAFFSIL